MTRLRTAWMPALILTLLAAPAEARRVRVEVIKKISLKQSDGPPSFTCTRRLRLLDRGRLLLLGKGLRKEQATFHLMKVTDRSVIRVAAPIRAFFAAHAGRFPDAGPWRNYRVEDLLYYDTTAGQAGVLLRERRRGSDQRRLYLRWDLNKKKILGARVLGRRTAAFPYVYVRPIGYAPKLKELYLQVTHGPPRGEQVRKLSVLALRDGKAREVMSRQVRRTVSRGPFYDAERNRALLVEYAERGAADPPPRGYLVPLSKGGGATLSMKIPLTTYGVSFSRDGKTVRAYSSQTGKLWVLRAKDGKRLRRVKVGKRGHALGRPFGGALLLVRNKGLLFLREGRLRKMQFVKSARLYPGFSHVEGSLVTPRLTAIKNRRTLHVLAFRRVD